MKILVTGASGFAGRHLLDLLDSGEEQRQGHRILALTGQTRLDSPGLARSERIEWRRVDLRSQAEVEQAIGTFRPEWVFHLAAKTQIVEADQDPAVALDLNAAGTLRLFESLSRRAPDARVVLASSAAVYGALEEKDLPAREDLHPVKPVGIYGVSKAAAEMLAHVFESRLGCPIVVLRLFNLIGPGQSEAFAASSFARQAAEIEAGLREPRVLVGNLKARRDLTDVRDVARAFRLAVELPPGGIYNVCSGKVVSMTEVAGLVLRVSGVPAVLSVDPNRVRASEISVVHGDPSRFLAKSAWTRRFTLEQSIRDLVDYWRRRLKG